MAIAPSGLIGLVIHGAAEAYTQEMIPDGEHKEYGYWHSNYHKSVRSNFDVLDLRIEKDPDAVVHRKITTSGFSQCDGVGLPPTMNFHFGGTFADACGCLGATGGVVSSVTYDADSKFKEPYMKGGKLDMKRGNDGKFRRRLVVPLEKNQ